LRIGVAIILASHLGRPKGAPSPEFSLAPIRNRLEELLKTKIEFVPIALAISHAESNALKDGEILLLENLRFHKEEEANILIFLSNLPRLQKYMLTMLRAAHRAHASIEGITHYLNIKTADI